jgi:hypothetical protein
MKSAPVITRSSACAAPGIHAGVRVTVLALVILNSPVSVCYPFGLTRGRRIKVNSAIGVGDGEHHRG